MHRKFMATIAAVSIAITGFSTAPAQADPDDVGRALAAVLGIAIVGAVIHDKKKDKKHVRHVQPAPRYKVKPHHRVHNHRYHKAMRMQRRAHTHRYGY